MATTTSTAAGSKKKFGTKRVGAATTKCPCPVRIHIHLDANRDSKVDDRWWLNGSWNPGKGKLGAVVLCNCDDEDGDKKEDHTNNKIDGGDDDTDIAPFHLRKHPPNVAALPGWKVKVEVLKGHEKLFRIFNNEKSAGTEILGPTTASSFQLTDLSPNEWKYGMEVNQYPGRLKDPGTLRGVMPITNDWDGYVVVKLSLLDDKDVVQDSEQAKIRCAPWVIFNHMDPTEEAYVVSTGDNGTIVGEIDAEAGVPVQHWSGGDRWMQDVVEIGFSTLPKPAPSPDMHLPVPLRTANRRDPGWGPSTLDLQIQQRLLGKNYGYYEAIAPIGNGSSLDSFGNLECVPPFKHPKTKRDYKFGRIIYGHGSGANHLQVEVTEFLAAQKVQFPFSVDTGWLQVGHIDEVLTFVPTTAGKFGFKAVFAGPKRALALLATLPPTTPVFRSVTDFWRVAADFTKGTVAQLLDTTTAPNIVHASEYAQTKIDQIKKALRKEIGLTDADMIDLPILFQQDSTSNCVAYTAGSANMLVVTHGPQTKAGARTAKLLIPKPFGPTTAPPGGATGSAAAACEFEKAIATALTLPGVTFKFIDDFVTYHAQMGEIHCGTNSKRKGPIDRFWWEQAGI